MVYVDLESSALFDPVLHDGVACSAPVSVRRVLPTARNGKEKPRRVHSENQAPDREARWLALLVSIVLPVDGRIDLGRKGRNHGRDGGAHLRGRGRGPALRSEPDARAAPLGRQWYLDV